MWLLIVIIAHLFNAAVFVIDKIILSKAVLKPISYAFLVGLFSGFSILFLPFIEMPSGMVILASLAAGVFFMAAIFLFLRALSKHEASRIVPTVGGLVPVFTFTFSYLFLNERLSGRQIFAFVFLVLGGILISTMKSKEKYSIKGFCDGAIAAFFFSSAYTMSKFIFLNTGFLDGYISIRVGSFLVALFIFFIPAVRRTASESFRGIAKFSKGRLEATLPLFLLSKSLAAVAALGIDFSIYLASATLVNSLQGVQYIFLLVIAALFSKRYAVFQVEGFRGFMLGQKIAAIMLIAVGLVLLSI